MVDPFWRTTGSDRSVNPNPPLGEDVVVDMLSGPAARFVLDYGCGFGRMSQRFPAYVGVDVNSGRVRACRARYPDKTFRTIQGPEDVALFTEEFTGAVFDNVLLHVWDADIERTLKCVCSKVSVAVVIAEHMDPKWRATTKIKSQGNQRSVEEYDRLMRSLGFAKVGRVGVLNPRWNEDMDIVRWDRRD